jgi:hypothetical protein
VSTGAPRRRGRGEKTQSADQFDDAGVEEILRLAQAANLRSVARRRRRFRRRALAVVLAAVVVLGGVAACRFGLQGNSHTSKRPAPSIGAAAAGPAPAAHSIPDFVWPAAKRAAHYRIEFLLGTRVVHTATTSAPRLHVAVASLPPGRYRWRVWALDKSGARVGRAVVDASVNIR